MKVNLTDLEGQRLGHTGTHNIEAGDLLLQARDKFNSYTPENVKKAIELTSQAIELDPNYAEAYAKKARMIIFPYATGLNGTVEETIIPGLVLARKAVELDNLLPSAHACLGWALMWNRHIDEAITEANKGVELHPNNDDGYLWQSLILSSAGRGKEALEAIEKGMRINPHYQVVYKFAIGTAYFALGQYDEAVSHFQRGIERNPNFLPNHMFKTATLALLDKKDEMEIAKAELLQINPNYPDNISFFTLFNDERLINIFRDGYTKAGLFKSSVHSV